MKSRLRSGLSATVAALATALGASATAQGAEITVQNDSTVGGVPSSPGNFFLAGEATAAWLTASCSGDIVAAQVYWTSITDTNPAQLEMSITLYDGSTFPTPGAVLQNQGAVDAVIVGPVLSDGTTNEFRFLDPPANTVPLRVPVTQGQTFVSALEFLNQSSGNPFASGTAFDTDGCTAGRNGVFVIPGGWFDACPQGVTGDWVMRAKIRCTPPVVPSSDWLGTLLLAIGLLAVGTLVARRAQAGTAALALPSSSAPRNRRRR